MTSANVAPFNELSPGLGPRMCYVGAFPRPYEFDNLSPGGQDRRRVGGLAWEVDVGEPLPHVCGRTVPGFRHFEYFEQAGPALQLFAAYDLGIIGPPEAANATLAQTRRSWTNCTLDYRCDGEGGPGSFSLTISRLTPAILAEGAGPSMVLFGGPQRNWRKPDNAPAVFEDQQRTPTHLATPGDGGPVVLSAGESHRLPLHRLGDGWLLFWWGERVFTTDSADPVLTTHFYRQHWWGREMWRDVPVLAVFEHAPREILPGEKGGLLVRWPGPAGKVALMPLFGARFPDTAGWGDGLPAEVVRLAEAWAPRLRMYPTGVDERYEINAREDAVTATSRVTFEPVGTGGTPFAPLPPMLALAGKYGFPVTVSLAPADTGCLTPVGPYVGVEADSYTWTVRGMGRYIDECLAAGPPSPEADDLRRELADEIDKVLRLGEPLIPLTDALGKRTPDHCVPAPWSAPADVFRFLPSAGLAARMPPERMRALLAYVNTVGQAVPPDHPGWTPYHRGVLRTTGLPPTDEERQALQREFEACVAGAGRNRAFFPGCGLVPPDHTYALWAYVHAGGEWDLPGRWRHEPVNLRPYLERMDWASLGWYRWKENYALRGKWGVQFTNVHFGSGGVADVNRWLAGLIGYTRLAQLAGDAGQESLGRYLFARGAALRFAMGVFARWLHDEGLVRAPDDPTWYVQANDLAWENKLVVRDSAGYPFALHWRGPQDDIRQVVILDEFGPSVRQTLKVYMEEVLPTFNHLVPEVARFMADHLRESCAAYVAQTEDHIPDWEVAWGDSVLGSESSTINPSNSLQLFLAKAHTLGASAQELRRRLDIPWCRVGDLYYMAKLAATIHAHDGVRWRPVRSR